jgi:NAD(P)-dependent dehydrogenase (short-subunit alcohol dehydrogenase family)
MLERGGGRIVTMTSGAAFAGEPVRPAYAVSKAGLTALTRHVAAAWGRKGIRCNAIAPGIVETEASQAAMGPLWEKLAKFNPTGRNGRPEDIAAMVAVLVGPDADWVNGQVLSVDGGTLMR